MVWVTMPLFLLLLHKEIYCVSQSDKEFPKMELIRSVYHELCSVLGVAIGDGKERSFAFNIYKFSKRGMISR